MINISQQAGNPWSKPTRQGNVHHPRRSRATEPRSQIRCRTDWMLRDEFLEKGWDTSCQDFFSFLSLPLWDFVWLVLFFTSEDLANHRLFFLHDILVSAHHGNGETMNVRAHSIMGRTTRGKWRAILNQSLYPICMCVQICYFKEKNLWQFRLLFFGKCGAVQKKWGYGVFFLLFFFLSCFSFHKSSCILLFAIRIPNFDKEHSLVLQKIITAWQPVSNWVPQAVLNDGNC